MLRPLLESFLFWGNKWAANRRKTSRARTLWRAHLYLERLETREVPAVILVTDGGDAGPGTLREAIEFANTTGASDDIQIDPSVTAIDLESSLPATFTNMNINGPLGGPLTTIAPAPGFGGFRIFEFGFNGTAVTLANLNITGGSANEGGAIWSWTNLTVANCVFTENSATGRGGAIFQFLAPLTVTGSHFELNTAGTDGGAISFESGGIQPLTVDNTIFAFNTAGLDGGAVFYWATGDVTFVDCQFFANTAVAGNGGAINCFTCGALTVVTTNPFAVPSQRNVAGGSGGLIFANVELNVTLNTVFSLNASGSTLSDAFFINLSPGASANINFALVFETFVLLP